MTQTNNNNDLKRKLIEQRLELVKLECQARAIEVRSNKLTMEHDEAWMKPHKLYHTKVYRHSDGEMWICSTGDPGDLLDGRPYGMGASPGLACKDFDRAWWSEED